jgi:serine/threonine protein kinase
MWKEHALQPGDVVRHPETGEAYRVLELIGIGSYAEVYKAEHVLTGVLYGLKVLRLHRAGSAKTRERHRREGEILLRVRHPNVVQVHAVIELDDGRVVMVMDLLVGRTLAQLCADCGGKLPINTALELMIQVCRGLAAVHALGVVHRDVKPENIFVCVDGVVRLCDLGVSQFPNERRITTDNTTIGTVQFMSPEQLYRPGEVGPCSDLFALGVILYEALAGVSPFVVDGKLTANLRELGYQIIFQPHVRLSVAAPHVPPDIAAVVESLLAKEPKDRPPSSAIVCKVLDAAHQAYLHGLAERNEAPVRISFVGRLPPVPRIDTEEMPLPPATLNPFVSISVPPQVPANDGAPAGTTKMDAIDAPDHERIEGLPRTVKLPAMGTTGESRAATPPPEPVEGCAPPRAPVADTGPTAAAPADDHAARASWELANRPTAPWCRSDPPPSPSPPRGGEAEATAAAAALELPEARVARPSRGSGAWPRARRWLRESVAGDAPGWLVAMMITSALVMTGEVAYFVLRPPAQTAAQSDAQPPGADEGPPAATQPPGSASTLPAEPQPSSVPSTCAPLTSATAAPSPAPVRPAPSAAPSAGARKVLPLSSSRSGTTVLARPRPAPTAANPHRMFDVIQ